METEQVRGKIMDELFPGSYARDCRLYKPMRDKIDGILEEFRESLTD